MVFCSIFRTMSVALVVLVATLQPPFAAASPMLEWIDTGVQPEKWAALNKVLQPYEKDGKLDMSMPLIQTYFQYASVPWVNTICKSRLYGGHAAMLLLLSNPKAKVYVYDAKPNAYAGDAAKVIEQEFPDRFFFSTSSFESFPKDHPGEKCDLMILGGTHGVDQDDDAQAEIAYFQAMANPEHHYVLVEDTPCSMPYCEQRKKMWEQAKLMGQVFEVGTQDLGSIGLSCGYLRPPQAPATQPEAPADAEQPPPAISVPGSTDAPPPPVDDAQAPPAPALPQIRARLRRLARR